MRGYLWEIVEEPKRGWKALASERGRQVDYDPSRGQMFVNEPSAPALENLDFQQPFQTDLNLPDTQRKDKELEFFSPERDNLQLWTSAGEYEYGAVMIPFPSDIAKKIRKWGEENIPEDILYTEEGDRTFGREDYIHTTALYGLTEDSIDSVKEVVLGVKPFELKLGQVEVFEHRDGYDVIHVKVELTPELLDLRKRLEQLPFKSDFPDYKPHVTIAYVKQGEGKKFVGDKVFQGVKVFVDTLVYSFKGDEKKRIPLESKEGSLKLSSPESYTDVSDTSLQDKSEFDERSLEFRQEDHLPVNNQRDWMWGETDYNFLNSPPIYQDIDEDQGKANIARSSLKLSWEIEDANREDLMQGIRWQIVTPPRTLSFLRASQLNVPFISSTEEALMYGRSLTPEWAAAFAAKREEYLQMVRDRSLPVQQRINIGVQAQFLREALEEYRKRQVQSALDLPNAEDYSGYNTLDPQPDEVLQHSPTVRKERQDIVKYRLDPQNEEMLFEKGLHQTIDRKENIRPVTPFGSLKFTEN